MSPNRSSSIPLMLECQQVEQTTLLSNLLPGVAAAFVGAFFAFGFMRLGDVLSRRRERWMRHHNALVRLERLTNEQVDALMHSVYQLDGMTAGINDALGRGGIPMLGNRPHPIPLDQDIEFDLANLDLINDVVAHRIHLSRINRDQEMISSAVSDLQTAFLDRLIDKDSYAANLTAFHDGQLPTLKKHVVATVSETKVLAAKSRVRLDRDRPWSNRAMLLTRTTRYEKDFSKAVECELRVLEVEINQTSRESAERIRATLDTPDST
jgi:hypothetical protein